MWWVIRGSNPGKDDRFFSSQKRADRFWGSPKLLSSGTTVHYRGGVNRRGVKLATHLRLVKRLRNEWSYTSTHPICLHGVDRDIFTFLFCLLARELKMIADIWLGWCASLLWTVRRIQRAKINSNNADRPCEMIPKNPSSITVISV
jgi:hypothetical protein